MHIDKVLTLWIVVFISSLILDTGAKVETEVIENIGLLRCRAPWDDTGILEVDRFDCSLTIDNSMNLTDEKVEGQRNSVNKLSHFSISSSFENEKHTKGNHSSGSNMKAQKHPQFTGFPSNNGGFFSNPNNGGFSQNPNNGGFNSNNGGFSQKPNNGGFNSNNGGFNSNNGGFNSNNGVSSNTNNGGFNQGGNKGFGSPHDMLILSGHNPSGKVDGGTLREGDILIPADQPDANTPPLWENGQIYIDMSSANMNLRNIILQAIKEWEDSSCLKFIHGCVNHNACVRVNTQTNLCSSLIGRAPGGQELKLASNCYTLKIVRHELGHVIGFFHEQSRYDRDNYIHINRQNLMPNTDQEFNKLMGNWGAEYDYSSVMQYDAKSFSSDRVNKNTMVTPNPHYQTLMGNSKNLSFRDKFRVNRMYSCSAKCPNRHIQCKNGGFLSPYKGNNQSCYCMCPPRISGKLCENKPYPYEYYDVPACSRNVTQATTIQTPNYPRRNYPPEKCSYWIQAPYGRRIQVQFEDFSFANRGNGANGPNQCYLERVEVRTQNLFYGDMYCGEDLKGRTLTSSSQNFIIIIDAEDNAQSMRGLKANVNFI